VERIDQPRLLLPLLAITLLAALLRLQGVADQPPLSDEAQVALSAGNYMDHGQFGPTMWYHPNLRNIVIHGLGSAFGYGPYALRGMSLFSGILSILVAGLLLQVLTGSRAASLLAAFLLAVEQVHITFSRQAIQETWTTFFMLLGVLLAVLAWKKDRHGMLAASGIVFGLGLASKFHAAFPLMVVLCAGIFLSGKERSVPKGLFAVSCLVLLPLIVYLLTYLPWFGRGYDLAEWVRMQSVLFHKMTTHTGNPLDQVVDTSAWQWFLRPMGYANFVFAEGRPFVTVAFSNPVVWLLVLPATVFLAHGLLKERYPEQERQGIMLLLALFVVSYAPLALSPRPIWLLSSLAVLPFGLMIAAEAVVRWTQDAPWGRKALWGYGAIVLVTSLALYPMAIGKAKEYGYLHAIVERFRPPFEQERGPNP